MLTFLKGHAMRNPFTSQLLRVMRLTTFIIFVFSLHVTAKSVSQTITLTGKDIPLKTVFTEIEKQCGYLVLYNRDVINDKQRVSVEAKDELLVNFLDKTLKSHELDFVIENKTILVKKKTVHPRLKVASASLPISGIVKNVDGKSLAKVSVTIKGTNTGTTTDNDGRFTLEVQPGDILVITSVGYTPKEIKIDAASTTLNLTLQISSSPLDEVQIIAYGETSRRFNTGNVSSLKAAEIERQPVNNPLAALAGRVPSLDVTQNTGVPGGGYSVQIRGKNSIANGNDPLYIIDGVPFISTSIYSFLSQWNIAGGNPLSSFNPADIESIEVLKDADATAIYGSRGANGVILITTKKGQAGKSRVTINAYSGIGKVPKKLKLLSTPQYLAMRHEAFANDGVTPDPNVDYDLTMWDTTRYTDWQKLLIGNTSKISDIQATLAGGGNNTQFVIGTGYRNEGTVFPGDFHNRKVSTHFNINHTSDNRKFNALFSGGYAVEKNNLPQRDLTNQAIMIAPVAPPIYDSAGDYNWANSTFFNPYANYLLQKFKTTTNQVIGNLNLSYQVLPGLTLKTNFGYTRLDLKENETAPTNSWLPAWGVKNGIAYFSNSAAKTWSVEPQIEWQKELFGGKINVLVGSSFQESKTDGQVVLGQGYVSNALLEVMSAAANLSILSSNYSLYRYNAAFARINYNWQQKYIINITGRRDGSSRFGPGKQFGNFGAIGGAWIFSEEPAIKNKFKFLSFGKLRASYGITGNDQISDYQFMSTYSPSIYPYNGLLGLLPTRLFNPDFAWETNRKFESGLELSFLQDRLFIAVSYYRNRSSNQLVGYPLPAITGFTSIQYNLPALVENKGWEIQFTTTNIKNKNVEWSTSFNATIPKNKLIAFDNIENTSYATQYAVGQSLFVKQSYPYLGVNPQTGIYEFKDSKGNVTSSPAYPADLQPIKTLEKTFYGGITNNVRYKSFELSLFIQFVKQTGWSWLYGGNQLTAPGMLGNQPAEVLRRWQQSGDVIDIPRFTQSYASEAFSAYSNAIYYGENRLADASYVRLKNVYLSYQLPQKMMQKMHLETLTIYVMGQNLLTITDYIGLDPETQSLQVLPPLRVIAAGLKITL